jgi:hypothetical protein
LFFVLMVVTSAWPKFKEDEQQYLNDQFKAIQDQLTAVTTQLQKLSVQLEVLRQNQAQFQAVIDHQQKSLQDLDQMVTSMRLGSEENFSSLKTVITQLRKDTLAGFKQCGMSGGTTGPGTTPLANPGAANPSQPVHGYVTDVKGSDVGSEVTLDVGSSSQGIHQGSRLAVYKASDPNTQVGLVEIIQVIDAGTSRAQIVTLNTGVKLAWGDVAILQ